MGGLGRKGGGLLRGSDWQYPEPLELKDDARELLAETGGAPELPDDALVFLMHQGYAFWFLSKAIAELSLGSNAIYLYKEGSKQFEKVADSLGDFILGQCDLQSRLLLKNAARVQRLAQRDNKK